MKRVKSFDKFINENYKVNNVTEADIIDCIKSGGLIYSDIVSDYPNNKDWKSVGLVPVDIEDNKVMVDIDGNVHYVKIENIKKIEWNADKKISELFDTEELKSKQEIDYLKGTIDKKSMVSDIIKTSPVESLRNRIQWDVPHLANLKAFAGPKTLYFKKDDTIELANKTIVFMYELGIELAVSRIGKPNGNYNMVYKIETLESGKATFSRFDEYANLTYNDLKNRLQNEVLNIVIEWNKESMIKYKQTPLPNVSKETLNLNQRSN